jgi:hypothetical protein
VWWIALQWSIALVIAAAFPADPTFDLLRGLLVALGGTLQLVLASSLCSGSSERERPPSLPRIGAVGASRNLGTGTARFRYAVALAVTVGIAAAAYRVVDFSNGYWIAMTILIVLRSELRDTVRITVTRITGTMAGAGVATNHRLFSAAVANHLGGADRRDGVGCYASLRVNYVLFSMLITGYIALLFAFGGPPGAGRGIASGHCHRDRRRCRACRTFSLRRPSCAPWRRHQRTATSLLSRSYWARAAPAPERRSRGCGVTRLSRDRGSSGRQKEPEIDSRQGSHAAPRRLST